jgi:succinate dehydrogenase / fumarate reductase membrane anchor subunit
MDFRSNLSKAKGLGASGDGTHHWLMQRLSAIFLILLLVWFIQFMYNISSKNLLEVLKDLQKPINCCGFILLVLSSLYHGMLGMQVIIEDYISNLAVRYFCIIALKFFVLITSVSFIIALVYFLTV